MSSLGSVYSTLPEKGDYSITGEVLFGVEYRSGQLLVHVVGARDLAAADKGGSSDPYVKTYLLPDKKKETKRKTKVVKKTLNPTYNETLKVRGGRGIVLVVAACGFCWDGIPFPCVCGSERSLSICSPSCVCMGVVEITVGHRSISKHFS